MTSTEYFSNYGDRPPADPLDLKVCNCAHCGRELAAPFQDSFIERLAEAGHAAPPPLAGRVRGRPYCHSCLCWAEAEQ